MTKSKFLETACKNYCTHTSAPRHVRVPRSRNFSDCSLHDLHAFPTPHTHVSCTSHTHMYRSYTHDMHAHRPCRSTPNEERSVDNRVIACLQSCISISCPRGLEWEALNAKFPSPSSWSFSLSSYLQAVSCSQIPVHKILRNQIGHPIGDLPTKVK